MLSARVVRTYVTMRRTRLRGIFKTDMKVRITVLKVKYQASSAAVILTSHFCSHLQITLRMKKGLPFLWGLFFCLTSGRASHDWFGNPFSVYHLAIKFFQSFIPFEARSSHVFHLSIRPSAIMRKAFFFFFCRNFKVSFLVAGLRKGRVFFSFSQHSFLLMNPPPALFQLTLYPRPSGIGKILANRKASDFGQESLNLLPVHYL